MRLVFDVASGAGNDHLFGESANDVLNGGAGDDVLSGGIGEDIFTFEGGFGQDTITDFEDGIDMIHFSDIADFNELTISEYSGYSTVANADGDAIRLNNVLTVNLGQDDFVFV
jgi:Ca2+-binding RTX toxin-like protein